MANSCGSVTYKLAQLYSYLFRVKELPFAERILQPPAPCIMHRPFFGFDLFVDVSRTSVQTQLYLMGERFIDERRLVARLLKPGGCVVDVGANIGYYLLMIESAIRKNGRVICFEPEPSNLVELKLNIEKNDLENVEVYEAAVGIENGTVGFLEGINGGVVENGEGDFSVDVVTLDAVIAERVDLLKIDVDGYEAQALIGAEKLIRDFRPTLFVEIHPHLLISNYATSDILNFVQSYYTNVSFYDKRRDLGAFRRIQSRYGDKGSVVAVKNVYESINQRLAGKIDEGFWMVCN